MRSTTIHHFIAAVSCAAALPLAVCGCSDQTPAGLGAAGPPSAAAVAQANREKMPAEAPANPAAQAAGGSGMPSQAQNGSGVSTGVAGRALVDKPADARALAAGGSGMPGPN